MYVYKDYNNYANMLGNKYNIVIDEKSEIIKGKGIFNNRLLKKKLSITPYINNLCSASCLFCSEKLERITKSQNKECKLYSYEEKLSMILKDLKDNDIFLSLSGKEPTESLNFLKMILRIFSEEQNISQKVMYSNLSGFTEHYDEFTSIISDYNLTRIETSRHHFNENINQNIMNFYSKHKDIMYNNVYSDIVSNLLQITPIKMVCVMQKTGISDIYNIMKYIEWANSIGIKEIVFRELSLFDESVKLNKVSQYINNNRVEVYDLIKNLDNSFELKSIFKGYYYFSFVYKYFDSIVTFEVSDYEEMIKHHNSNVINKLIYYPNKNLCLDWNMQNIIF